MSNKASCLGVISSNELYTLKEFMSRMALTDTAMRELRKKGFVVVRVGKRAFIPGCSAIKFLVEKGVGSNEGQSGFSEAEVLGSTLEMPENRQGSGKASENEYSP